MPPNTLAKLNLRIVAVCCGIIFFAFLDRGNLGLAANDVCEDLKLSHSEYGTGVSLFYLGYVSTQVISNVLLKRFGAPFWLAIILAAWGIIAGSFAFMQARWQFYFLRVLLGMAEGGTFPGVWYYITLFYPDNYLAQPFNYTIASIYVSIPTSVPIAAGLLQLDGVFDQEGWRHLFFIEGVLPFLYSIFVYFSLPRSLQKANFLTPEEKEWIVRQQGCDLEDKGKTLNLIEEIKIVSKNRAFWILTLASIVTQSAFGTLSYWITLIINDMLDDDEDDDDDETCGSSGKHKTIAILLTAIPFVFGAICSFAAGRLVDLVKNRTRLYGYFSLFSGLSLLSWVLTKGFSFAFGFLSLTAAVGVLILGTGVYVTLVASLFDQEARSAAFSLANSVAMIGSIFLPPILGVVVDSYGYSIGILLLAILCFFSAVLCFSVKDPNLSPSSEEEGNERQN